MTKPELIYVVKRNELFKNEIPQRGLHCSDFRKIVSLIKEKGFFEERNLAEDNPSFKQIIPYVLFYHEKNLFLLHRFATQTEKRLHHKYSLGVGGHINPPNKKYKKLSSWKEDTSPIEFGLWKELKEEILFHKKPEPQLVGFINDDTTPVGKVHFGVFYKCEVKPDDIEVQEKNLMEGSFVHVSNLNSFTEKMETWSKILVENLTKFFL